METKKIGFACFIGGTLCGALALWFSPTYWWLGLIAGGAGGYISYEFRESYQAVPIALNTAGKGSVRVWNKSLRHTIEWFSRPHPFFYLPAIVSTLSLSLFLGTAELLSNYPEGLIIITMIFILFPLVAFVPIAILAFIGARIGEKSYWWPRLLPSEPRVNKARLAQLKKGGLQHKPTTYSNVLRWVVKGIGIITSYFMWGFWRDMGIECWESLCFLSRFAKEFLVLIRSHKRLLCAINSAIGGGVSYLMFFSSQVSSGEQVMLIFFGGLIGAGLGILNWEIISKRILQAPSDT